MWPQKPTIDVCYTGTGTSKRWKNIPFYDGLMVNAHFVALFFSGAPFTPLPALLCDSPSPPAFAPLKNYLLWSSCHLLPQKLYPCTRLSQKGYATPFFTPFFSGRKLKSGLGRGLLAKIINRKDTRNMARSSFFSLFLSPYFLSLFLFSIFYLFKCATNMYQYFAYTFT